MNYVQKTIRAVRKGRVVLGVSVGCTQGKGSIRGERRLYVREG